MVDIEQTSPAGAGEEDQGSAAGGPDPLADFFLADGEGTSGELGGYGGHDTSQAGVEERELMVFGVSDEQYAIDIDEVQEIIKIPEITEVPRVGAAILGVTSLRGTIVPILDLRVVLGLDVTELSRLSRILVIKAGGDPVGLVVDRVTSVVRMPRDSVEATPLTMNRESAEMLAGVGRLGEELVIILEIAAVIRAMERLV